MTPTYESAMDEILGLFSTYWNAQTPAVNSGSVPAVAWPGVEFTPPVNAPWARITVKHNTSRQVTFGEPGQRRFLRPGLVTVQVFTPVSAGGGLSLVAKLGIIARDAFEGRGTATGIWFRNARIQEVGDDGTWHQHNVVVEFEYDEVR